MKHMPFIIRQIVINVRDVPKCMQFNYIIIIYSIKIGTILLQGIAGDAFELTGVNGYLDRFHY